MGWDEIRAWMNNAAKAAAGVVSPPAHSPGAVGVAGIRSMLPGSRSFEQELEAYNRDAAPSPLYSPTSRFGSVVTDPAKPLEPSGGERERQMQMVMQMPMLGPTAYHGSPHVFDKFSSAKIGTGEGAQAYGHGLYFTSEPKVAEGYRANLARPGRLLVEGKELGDPSQPHLFWKEAMDWFPKGQTQRAPDGKDLTVIQQILEMKRDFWAKEEAKWAAHPEGAESAASANRSRAEYQQALDYAKSLVPESVTVSPPGSFHQVDIPDNLLAWDKTLAEQPEVVARLEKAGVLSPMAHGDFALTPHGPQGEGTRIRLGEEYGKTLYDRIGMRDPVEASKRLQQVGIPGHSYIGDSSNVRNFVMYDDAAIKPMGRWSSLQEFLRSQEQAP